uniref:Cystin 1 n=1 Tax=Rousettus aegyptiacus TaxID=9407 RepID=A0A7J8FF54_ROUAE|nr:cystin 1 [Rousettus aegyptiacus]
MGSGSSRSGRALRRLRGAESRPAGPGGAAAEGGTGPPAAATAATREEAPAAASEAAGRDPDPDPGPGRDPDPDPGPGPGPGPAAPPDGRDETLRLLDQLLAESAAWGPGEPAPRGPAPPRPAVSPKQSAEDHPGNSSISEAPGSSHKRPERQSAISYDYAEEELMASIEQEYCR